MSDATGFEIMQIAATLAAGLLSNNPQAVSEKRIGAQAEIAIDLYKACLQQLQQKPPKVEPPRVGHV